MPSDAAQTSAERASAHRPGTLTPLINSPVSGYMQNHQMYVFFPMCSEPPAVAAEV